MEPLGNALESASAWARFSPEAIDYNGRGINDIEPTPDPGFANPVYDSMDIREYRYKRTRYGFGGSLDYKLRRGIRAFISTISIPTSKTTGISGSIR